MHELLEQPEELQTGILIEVTGQLKGIFLFMTVSYTHLDVYKRQA